MYSLKYLHLAQEVNGININIKLCLVKTNLISKSFTACSEFECRKGPCVDRSWLCDGTKDCPKGDDEENCGEENKSAVAN